MTPDHPFVLNLPELSDEAVVAVHSFLQDLLDRFENQYFAQMHRYYQDVEEERRQHHAEQRQPQPADDPPF
jgi:hypothetical protein